ncbi:MAG: hypothetical protein K0S86_2219 [Geminicoccaceae bacterium]|nr:hypothetical protein [Geminicoccaceae bacterium]
MRSLLIVVRISVMALAAVVVFGLLTGPLRTLMAKGLFTVLCGWSLYIVPPAFLVFTGVLAVAMHVVVRFVEEPKLRRRFGPSYLAYCEDVGRWLPRRRSMRM